MKLAIVRESRAEERRVAATPDTVGRLIKKQGFEVLVEAGAGVRAGFADELFEQAGATVVGNAHEAWGTADVVLKVNPPEQLAGEHEVDLMREGATLLSFIWPAKNPELLERLVKRRISCFAMDAVPRVSRAQKMDALSSMANIAGYRAVIESASLFGRFFMGQMTAAGKVPPAKVMIIGAGVAGLAAIGAARSLGAIVRAFDTRPAVKEQVESLGAEFLELDFEEDGTGQGGYAKLMSPQFIEAEMALFMAQAREVDVIITTALIPGRKAPTLITEEMVQAMRAGSVVMDLAAEAGGNCALTEPGGVVTKHGVQIAGYLDLPGRLAPTASQLYGMNLVHFLSDVGGADEWNINMEDVVLRGALVTHSGELLWPPPPLEHPQEGVNKSQSIPLGPPGPSAEELRKKRARSSAFVLLSLFSFLGLLGFVAPAAFIGHLTVFVLACFVGWQVVWNVTAALHTPLMSVTNAISGIIIVGGMLQVSGPVGSPAMILGSISIFLATINISGGFWVTQRMLKMFSR